MMISKAMEKIVKRAIVTMQSSSKDESNADEESDEEDQSLMAKEDSDLGPEDLLALMENSDSDVDE